MALRTFAFESSGFRFGGLFKFVTPREARWRESARVSFEQRPSLFFFLPTVKIPFLGLYTLLFKIRLRRPSALSTSSTPLRSKGTPCHELSPLSSSKPKDYLIHITIKNPFPPVHSSKTPIVHIPLSLSSFHPISSSIPKLRQHNRNHVDVDFPNSSPGSSFQCSTLPRNSKILQERKRGWGPYIAVVRDRHWLGDGRTPLATGRKFFLGGGGGGGEPSTGAGGPPRHVTVFIGKSHVSGEIIGLCEGLDKWSTAYGASRTTEARFRSTILSFGSAPTSPRPSSSASAPRNSPSVSMQHADSVTVLRVSYGYPRSGVFLLGCRSKRDEEKRPAGLLTVMGISKGRPSWTLWERLGVEDWPYLGSQLRWIAWRMENLAKAGGYLFRATRKSMLC
ncbi:hypothetical protein KM043_011216 [Ampulex compressa]|nr:hypothetical protein KM043_011216 [Ampulex compressa]